MSEEQGTYDVEQEVSEAMEMLGKGYESATVIEPPREILERSQGGEFVEVVTPAWIKFSTAFKDEMPKIGGSALKVWIYIALCVDRKGQSFPAIGTIAEGIGMSHQTVINAIGELEKLGLLSVRRGEKRHNIYHVSSEFVTIGAANPMSQESRLVKKLDGNSQKSTPDQSSPLDSNKRLTRDNKKGDIVDGVLFFAKQAKDQQIDKIEEVIQQLERGLRVNIGRSMKSQQVAKRILKDGRSIDKWLSWVMAEEWRAAHTYLYADLERVWRDWPQAFEQPEASAPTRPEHVIVRAEPNPKYVPAPAGIRTRRSA